MDESRRGIVVRALRFLQNPVDRLHALPKMNGVILHEIPESLTGRHRFFVKWDNGGTFYVFGDEISIDTNLHATST